MKLKLKNGDPVRITRRWKEWAGEQGTVIDANEGHDTVQIRLDNHHQQTIWAERKSVRLRQMTHTPLGYDVAWLPPINGALKDRECDIELDDISDEIWERWLGPMLDAIEKGEV